MELGLTWPLQRVLKLKPLALGAEPDRRICWDIHIIRLRGRDSLLAVHCHSRYTFVLFDLSIMEWKRLPDIFLEGLRCSLITAGIPDIAVDEYICLSDVTQLTRTHGRREIAFLNRAWEDVLALDYCLDITCREQPLMDYAVNTKACRCVGFDSVAPAIERIAESIRL